MTMTKHTEADFKRAGSYTRTDEDSGVAAEALTGSALAAHFRDKRDMERARAEKAECHLRDRTVDLVEAIEERDKARREREHLRASLKEADAALRASREQPVVPTGEMVGRLFRAAGEVVPGWGVSMNDCHHLLQVALTEPTRSKRAEAIEAILADQLGGDVIPHTIRALADRIDSEVQP